MASRGKKTAVQGTAQRTILRGVACLLLVGTLLCLSSLSFSCKEPCDPGEKGQNHKWCRCVLQPGTVDETRG